MRSARYIEGHWYIPVEDYHELREALGMAVYHAVNLKRLKNAEVVRDFGESQAGFVKAVQLLESLEEAA